MSVIVWDVETVPDLKGFARANSLNGKTDDEIREAIGDKFPKHIYHSIICIGALIVSDRTTHWEVEAIGAPHVGERTEKELITAFVNKIDELKPQLVTFNGSGFDLPVLRYRAMVNEVSAPGLTARPYFNRYTEDTLDLCDVLASFNFQCRASLDEICRLMGMPGKPVGLSGSDVETYFRDGKIDDIAAYCESDVVNTYRLWLRHELFRGKLDQSKYEASERRLRDFLDSRKERFDPTASSGARRTAKVEIPVEDGLLDDLREALHSEQPDPEEDRHVFNLETNRWEREPTGVSDKVAEKRVACFAGLSIKIWADEHPPPHIHVSYQGEDASFSILDCVRLPGTAGLERYERTIREWWSQNIELLIETWNESRPSDCRVGKVAKPIALDR